MGRCWVSCPGDQNPYWLNKQMSWASAKLELAVKWMIPWESDMLWGGKEGVVWAEGRRAAPTWPCCLSHLG